MRQENGRFKVTLIDLTSKLPQFVGDMCKRWSGLYNEALTPHRMKYFASELSNYVKILSRDNESSPKISPYSEEGLLEVAHVSLDDEESIKNATWVRVVSDEGVTDVFLGGYLTNFENDSFFLSKNPEIAYARTAEHRFQMAKASLVIADIKKRMIEDPSLKKDYIKAIHIQEEMRYTADPLHCKSLGGALPMNPLLIKEWDAKSAEALEMSILYKARARSDMNKCIDALGHYQYDVIEANKFDQVYGVGKDILSVIKAASPHLTKGHGHPPASLFGETAENNRTGKTLARVIKAFYNADAFSGEIEEGEIPPQNGPRRTSDTLEKGENYLAVPEDKYFVSPLTWLESANRLVECPGAMLVKEGPFMVEQKKMPCCFTIVSLDSPSEMLGVNGVLVGSVAPAFQKPLGLTKFLFIVDCSFSMFDLHSQRIVHLFNAISNGIYRSDEVLCDFLFFGDGLVDIFDTTPTAQSPLFHASQPSKLGMVQLLFEGCMHGVNKTNGTNIFKTLEQASEFLKESTDCFVVLVTDGDDLSSYEKLKNMRSSGLSEEMKIYPQCKGFFYVGIGDSNPEMGTVCSFLNPFYFNLVVNEDNLQVVCDEIFNLSKSFIYSGVVHGSFVECHANVTWTKPFFGPLLVPSDTGKTVCCQVSGTNEEGEGTEVQISILRSSSVLSDFVSESNVIHERIVGLEKRKETASVDESKKISRQLSSERTALSITTNAFALTLNGLCDVITTRVMEKVYVISTRDLSKHNAFHAVFMAIEGMDMLVTLSEYVSTHLDLCSVVDNALSKMVIVVAKVCAGMCMDSNEEMEEESLSFNGRCHSISSVCAGQGSRINSRCVSELSAAYATQSFTSVPDKPTIIVSGEVEEAEVKSIVEKIKTGCPCIIARCFIASNPSGNVKKFLNDLNESAETLHSEELIPSGVFLRIRMMFRESLKIADSLKPDCGSDPDLTCYETMDSTESGEKVNGAHRRTQSAPPDNDVRSRRPPQEPSKNKRQRTMTRRGHRYSSSSGL